MSRANWTGRCNRSLVEAFGPYTTQHIESTAEPYTVGDAVIAVIAVLSLAGIVLGVI